MRSKSTKSNNKKSAPPPNKLAARGNDALILLSVLATLAAMAWIINGRPIGVAGEWTWPTRVVIGAKFWTPLPGAALLIAVAGWLTRPKRWERTRRKIRIVWIIAIFLIAWILAAGMLAMPKHPVLLSAATIASPQATSYFNVATEIDDVPEFLRNYPALMETFPLHARTHPPGPVLFFRGIVSVFRASPALTESTEKICSRLDSYGTEELAETLNQQFGLKLSKSDAMAAVLSALLLAGLGSLSIFPLYRLASSIFGSVTAIRAVLLFAVIPSFLLFAPAVDQLVLLFAVLILWAFRLWQKSGNPVVGLFLALGAWVSLGVAVVGLFLVIWWISEKLDKTASGTPQKRSLLLGICSAAGLFGLVFVLFWVLFGLNFVEIVKTGLAAHRHETVEEISRTYWKWIIYDPVEFAVFLGLPLTIWALWGVRGAFALAWLFTLLLVDLSGWVRAEVGRIWLFLMPPAAILAAARLGRLGKRFDFGFFSAMVLQLGQAITMKAGLDIFILK